MSTGAHGADSCNLLVRFGLVRLRLRAAGQLGQSLACEVVDKGIDAFDVGASQSPSHVQAEADALSNGLHNQAVHRAIGSLN